MFSVDPKRVPTKYRTKGLPIAKMVPAKAYVYSSTLHFSFVASSELVGLGLDVLMPTDTGKKEIHVCHVCMCVCVKRQKSRNFHIFRNTHMLSRFSRQRCIRVRDDELISSYIWNIQRWKINACFCQFSSEKSTTHEKMDMK